MKLRNLNGAIRKIDGPVMIKLVIGDGVLEIGLVKSTLIENLKSFYGDDNTVETSLTINGSHLCHEDGSLFGGGAVKEAIEKIASAQRVDAEDDLLSLGDVEITGNLFVEGSVTDAVDLLDDADEIDLLG